MNSLVPNGIIITPSKIKKMRTESDSSGDSESEDSVTELPDA